jgi:hypothetical protein
MSTVYVFVLGRAGCGKSAATRYMTAHLPQEWEIERITDYKLLHDKFRNGDSRFRATRLDGFDVIEFSVLDEVLDEVQAQARALEQRSSTKNTLVTIEFARDDYKQSLQQFNNEFLKKSQFLFIDAELETCIERVHQRINQKPARFDNLNASDDLLNNHFVSDTILRSYYHSSQHNLLYMSNQFHKDFSIDPYRIHLIENNGDLKEFTDQVDSSLKEIILATAGQSILVGATPAPGQVLLKAETLFQHTR